MINKEINEEDLITPAVIDGSILGMASAGMEPPYMICIPTLKLLSQEVAIERIPPRPTPDPEFVCVATYGQQIYFAIPYPELMQCMVEGVIEE